METVTSERAAKLIIEAESFERLAVETDQYADGKHWASQDSVLARRHAALFRNHALGLRKEAESGQYHCPCHALVDCPSYDKRRNHE